MDSLLGLVSILLLGALICIPVGFIKPDLFHSWFRRKLSRLQTGLSFVGISFVLLVAGVVVSHFTPSTSSSVVQTASAPTPTKSMEPTPTPNDPCAAYVGTDQYASCMDLEDARQKGAALEHPLKATVTFDSLYLYVTNTENNEWKDCTATLDDTNPEGDNFQSDIFTLKPGESQTISWGNFSNLESQRFNYFQTKPQFVDLDCTVGGQEHRSLFNL